jgi:hypothetical protein
MTWFAIIGGYLLIGIIGFLMSLHYWGWDNAKKASNGRFYLTNEDVGFTAVMGALWPIVIVVLAGIKINDSAQEGRLGRLVERRPPKKYRKEILEKRTRTLERSTGIAKENSNHGDGPRSRPHAGFQE